MCNKRGALQQSMEIVLLVKRICCKFATAKGVFFDILLSETFVHVLSPPPIGCEWLSN